MAAFTDFHLRPGQDLMLVRGCGSICPLGRATFRNGY